METAVVYMQRELPFKSANEITALLGDLDWQKISYVPAHNPKGGEVYVYAWEDDEKCDDWRADQVRWKNGGTKTMPRNSLHPKFVKYYHHVMLENGASTEFQRHAYRPVDRTHHLTVIQYIGDETLVQPRAHGNAKNTKPFIPTAKSVLKRIKTGIPKSPMKVYRDQMWKDPVVNVLEAVMKPRNLKQVKNVQYLGRQRKRLTQDDLFNLHELAYSLDGFVHKIETFPNLVCVVGDRHMLEELDMILQIQDNQDQLLSYDTTFQLGDFYVSPLVFRHVMFENSPAIPVAFLVHERKSLSCHTNFYSVLKEKVKSLAIAKFPIVTDREQTLRKAILEQLPNADHLFCWNHIRQDTHKWLRNHNVTSAELSVYMSVVMDLLMSSTEKAFDEALAEKRKKWSDAFVQYFDEHLKEDLRQHAGRWILEQHKLYSRVTGVTTHQPEGLTTIMETMQNWRELPVDVVVLSLHHLQKFLLTEIRRGMCGLGTFSLRSEFSSSRKDPEEVIIPRNLTAPEDIVSMILNQKYTLHTPGVEAAVEGSESDSGEENDTAVLDQSLNERTQTCRSTTTQFALSHDTARHSNVRNSPGSSAMTVEGSRYPTHAVVFPRKEYPNFYHGMAVKLVPATPITSMSILKREGDGHLSSSAHVSARKRPRINEAAKTAISPIEGKVKVKSERISDDTE